MIDKTQTICKEIFITNQLFAFKFNVIMATLVRIYQVNIEGQSQADCCVWSCACGPWWIYLQLALYSVSHIPPLCLFSAFPQTNTHSCFTWARTDHPETTLCLCDHCCWWNLSIGPLQSIETIEHYGGYNLLHILHIQIQIWT